MLVVRMIIEVNNLRGQEICGQLLPGVRMPYYRLAGSQTPSSPPFPPAEARS